MQQQKTYRKLKSEGKKSETEYLAHKSSKISDSISTITYTISNLF